MGIASALMTHLLVFSRGLPSRDIKVHKLAHLFPLHRKISPSMFLPFVSVSKEGYSNMVLPTWAPHTLISYFLCDLALGRVLGFFFFNNNLLCYTICGVPPLFPICQSFNGTVFLSSLTFIFPSLFFSSFPSLSRAFHPLKP